MPSLQYPDVDNDGRRIYSAMVSGMDMAVGQIVEALKENDLYGNSLLLFSSDVMMIHSVEAYQQCIRPKFPLHRTEANTALKPTEITTRYGARRTPFGRAEPEFPPFSTGRR